MNVPGFTAEASLGWTKVKSQRSTVFGSSSATTVLPMQGFTAAPVAPWNCYQTCLTDCEANCLSPGDCIDFPGWSVLGCLNAAKRCAGDCRKQCVNRCWP
jgi:hypothetical protein